MLPSPSSSRPRRSPVVARPGASPPFRIGNEDAERDAIPSGGPRAGTRFLVIASVLNLRASHDPFEEFAPREGPGQNFSQEVESELAATSGERVASEENGGREMGARGFEPRTSPLSGVRSSRLSYAPESSRAFHSRISWRRVNGMPVQSGRFFGGRLS